jgi:uncharacterized protein
VPRAHPDDLRCFGPNGVNFTEKGISFACGPDTLVGVLTIPERPAARSVLIVIGGPQYRAGSHRQFTLLARALANAGFAALRFDYRGMGDSSGDRRSFEDVQDDIRAATDVMYAELPFLAEVVIWGLCDAASAGLFYSYKDCRISGLVIVNPWVRTIQGEARAYVKHYYVSRLSDAELWRKVLKGNFDFWSSIKSLASLLRTLLRHQKKRQADIATNDKPLPERMLDAWAKFRGRLLLILSGDDFTAQEFRDVVQGSARWKQLVGGDRVARFEMPEANHTFSRREWRDQVAEATLTWLRSW